jgi:hypothetical protein
MRIDQLTEGAEVVLGFTESHGMHRESATFVGRSGEGEDRLATFSTPPAHATFGQSYEWEAYRHRGRWCYGTSAQTLRLLEVQS